MAEEPTAMLNVRRFPVALQRRVKAQAAMEGITMRDLIVRVLDEYMDKVQQPKPKRR